ncbi:MAG: peptidoglycan DD-metalloendopeptidase family protein [Actinobacteria bacterium]|nr:peptidoglycan DD-metalloendopeptidase family protein [Actinomycetota bacterium]
MLSLALALATSGGAHGESLKSLQERMDEVQDRLDRATERVESLRDEAGRIDIRLRRSRARRTQLQARHDVLERKAAARAVTLYQSGQTDMLEVFLGSSSISELADGAMMLSLVAEQEDEVFTAVVRSDQELAALNRALETDRARLRRTAESLEEESGELQDTFSELSSEYDALKRRLEAAARRAAQAEAESSASTTSAPPPAAPVAAAPVAAAPAAPSGGMACPVGGAVSFIDSWGDPRAGHTHQGVDMMAGYGTPVMAITSGVVTLSSYGSSSGNWIILSGSDGNAYWYMHNEQNLVSSGSVAAGQQIATVGDTGNAAGTPHVHFEYHPGGGAAVNPYPLVASIC